MNDDDDVDDDGADAIAGGVAAAAAASNSNGGAALATLMEREDGTCSDSDGGGDSAKQSFGRSHKVEDAVGGLAPAGIDDAESVGGGSDTGGGDGDGAAGPMCKPRAESVGNAARRQPSNTSSEASYSLSESALSSHVPAASGAPPPAVTPATKLPARGGDSASAGGADDDANSSMFEPGSALDASPSARSLRTRAAAARGAAP
eukprot:298319-Chlamydomonas_euryale.AAC.1